MHVFTSLRHSKKKKKYDTELYDMSSSTTNTFPYGQPGGRSSSSNRWVAGLNPHSVFLGRCVIEQKHLNSILFTVYSAIS